MTHQWLQITGLDQESNQQISISKQPACIQQPKLKEVFDCLYASSWICCLMLKEHTQARA